jgi:hypothetical protein
LGVGAGEQSRKVKDFSLLAKAGDWEQGSPAKLSALNKEKSKLDEGVQPKKIRRIF